MKTIILLSICMLLISLTGFSTKWTIVNSGLTFSPSTISISNGDSINFSLASIHNVLEVSEATWNADDNTALPGGFSLPYGGGLVLPAQLTVGTHYYVCQPHASLGMKGTITVLSTTGIGDFQTAATFSVYPNPTSGLLSIKTEINDPSSEYRIINLLGKQVTSGLLNNNTTQVDMNQFSPGVYFVELVGKRNHSLKVVKF